MPTSDGSISEIPATTGADGWYRIDNVPGGLYSVREALPAGFVLGRGFDLVQGVIVRGGTEQLCNWGNRRDYTAASICNSESMTQVTASSAFSAHDQVDNDPLIDEVM
jgi:hypothetical protein